MSQTDTQKSTKTCKCRIWIKSDEKPRWAVLELGAPGLGKVEADSANYQNTLQEKPLEVQVEVEAAAA
jgi:hypothetical protein